MGKNDPHEGKQIQFQGHSATITLENHKIPIPDDSELRVFADPSVNSSDSSDETNIARFAKALETLRYFGLIYYEAVHRDAMARSHNESIEAENNEPEIEFGLLGQKWDSMEDVSIIREALLSGQVSLAISFLQSRKFYRSGPMSTQSNLKQKRLKEEAFALIYQAVTRSEVKIARKMLRSIDADEVAHFREIFLRTTRHSVRHVLLDFDQSRNILKLADLPRDLQDTFGSFFLFPLFSFLFFASSYLYFQSSLRNSKSCAATQSSSLQSSRQPTRLLNQDQSPATEKSRMRNSCLLHQIEKTTSSFSHRTLATSVPQLPRNTGSR